MGFDKVKTRLIDSLIKHEFKFYTERTKILDKNKLYTGEVEVYFVLNLIEECEKESYYTKHSWDADDYKSHIFKSDGWYIKFIFKDDIVNIISVHKDEPND